MDSQEGRTLKYLNRSITRRQAIKAGGIGAVGLAFSKPLIETIVPKPAFADYVSKPPDDLCKPICIDFDENGINEGDVITSQYIPSGIAAIYTKNYGNAGHYPDVHAFNGSAVAMPRHPAVIFNSDNPTSNTNPFDYDLGTPNQVYAGPGIGSGGASNSIARHQILIIQEQNVPSGTTNISGLPAMNGVSQDQPDDRAAGGRLVFLFTQPVRVDEVGLLDVDDGNRFGTRVMTFNDPTSTSAAALVDNVQAAEAGNNSYQTVVLSGSSNIRRLEVVFKSSGAVSHICYCLPN